MIKREPLFTEQYFDEKIKSDTEATVEIKEELKNPHETYNVTMAYFMLFEYRRKLFISKYSRGYGMETLHEDFLKIIETWEQVIATDTDNAYRNSFEADFENCADSLSLLSQAYLLKVGDSWIKRLLSCIRNEGEDLLFEKLVAAKLRHDRKPAKKLLYPKLYQTLLDVVDAPAPDQAKLMQKFLKGWYASMKNAGWHDLHKNGDDSGFYGYWCFEAAGVALALGIDDGSFRDMPFYPKDMAVFGRS